MPNLERLFNPRHVALLGVSRSPHRDSNAYLRVLVESGYQGRISVLGAADYGQAEAIESVESLPEGIDVVFNMLRPSLAEETLVKAARRGAKFGVIFAGGFAEASQDGADAQTRIVEACAEYGMHVVGPNCMGLFNTWSQTNLSEILDVPRGHIGLVSQSGNNGITLVHEARKYGTGLSSFVSFGNQSDLPAHAYIKHMGDDPNTKVIALYLEGLRPGDATEFIQVCREVSLHTPIVALKGGRGDAGSRAAASHTSSLARVPRAYSALFRQAGIIEVEDLNHLLPAAQALIDCPPLAGDRISVVGSGGGHSTVAADALEAAGFAVPEFSEVLQKTLAERLPYGAPVGNPIDMTGAYLNDATLFASLAEETITQDDFDGVLCYGLYGPAHWPATQPDPSLLQSEAGPALADLQQESGKPVLFFTIYSDRNHPHIDVLRSSGIPTFPDMGSVTAAMRALRQRGLRLQEEQGLIDSPVDGADVPSNTPALSENRTRTVLDESASLQVIEDAGVPVPEQVMVNSAAMVADAIARLGRTAVVKGVLPGIAHKSELGAVKLGLRTPEDGRRAAEDIIRSVHRVNPKIRVSGFIVAEDLGHGRELILGVQRDPVLGTIALLGIGGIHAEQFDDVSLGITPLSERTVSGMVSSLSAAGLFTAVRGEAPVDLVAISAALNGLAKVLENRSDIESIDVNPVIVRSDGSPIAVDAAVHLSV